MKNILIVCSLVIVLIGFMTFNARADQITGAISFRGTSSIGSDYNLSNAPGFTGFSNVTVSGGTGDYALVLSDLPVTVTFNRFSFRPAVLPIKPLWTFEIAGKIYSFNSNGGILISSTVDTLTIEGSGIAHITGFVDTPGNWYYSSNYAGSTGSFSASTVVRPVPEPVTMLLLGFGLIGIAGIRRFKK